jgi:PAS domain S-box-containing protein
MTSKPRQDRSVRILLLEDSQLDGELLAGHLGRAGLTYTLDRVETQADFENALRTGGYDLVLSDFALPGFDGHLALRLARDISPDTPFIFVSGVLGELFATESLKQGATDYVLKRNLMRLPSAVDRALAEAHERRERRRAEAALSASEISTRIALEAASFGLWAFMPTTGQLQWDRRCREMFGTDPAAPLDYSVFLGSVHSQDRERMDAAVQQAILLEGTREIDEEFRILHPSAGERWIATRGRSIFEGKVCVRFTGVVQDITEQKRAQQALRELNERLEASVEQRTRERDRIWHLSRDLLCVLSADGVMLSVNPAWTGVLGWRSEDITGRPFYELLHPDDLSATRAALARLFADDASPRFVARCRHHDGSFRWLSGTAATEDGLMYCVARDITSEREAAAELEAANRQLLQQIAERERVEKTLQQMQRLDAVGQLTSGVAHDFNNLLTVILGNVTFIERGLSSAGGEPSLMRRLSHMRIAAERGAKLTSQLLSFSRRQRLEPKPLDLNETVHSMRDLLQSTMGGSIQIETNLSSDLWPALVDPTQIELIILNLAINARDAMAVGGSLTVATSNTVLYDPPRRPEEPGPGEYVMLSVADTGAGMSDEVLAKAFEPFFTTKEVGKGSGLGLAQVFGFAKQSGGGVQIETCVGRGTEVRVLMPRASVRGVESAVGGQRSADPGRPHSGRKILVVDDDASVREITVTTLSELGYVVVEAGSGGAALDQLDRAADIDLLVVDYAMPGMNGADVVREAQSRRPGLPYLYLTGYADLGALKEVGENGIVQKPFQEEELAAKIVQALSKAIGAVGIPAARSD